MGRTARRQPQTAQRCAARVWRPSCSMPQASSTGPTRRRTALAKPPGAARPACHSLAPAELPAAEEVPGQRSRTTRGPTHASCASWIGGAPPWRRPSRGG
eukprot:741881-Alexandrium_andersonii.AAC.1